MCKRVMEADKNQLIYLKQHLERYVKPLPVFGFNSKKRDQIFIFRLFES